MPLVTWKMTAATGNYNDGNNWDSTVPPGPIDAAIFGTSSQTSLTVSGHVTTGEWVFTPGAPAYTLTLDPAFATVLLVGGGIIVNGGAAHIVLASPSDILGFDNTSTAGASTITNNGGQLDFDELTTAGSANITNSGGVFFANAASAGTATIHTLAGGAVEFDDFSTGGNAVFTTDAGATVDFSHSTGPAGNHVVTVGSIAGAGTYDLGANQLIVEGNGLPATVSGAVDDGGLLAGSGASLVKAGKGTLTLSGAHNTYSGGTTIEQGTLDLAAIGAAGPGAVAFAGGATLRIENAALSSGHSFANPIDGFAKHDVIDLAGLKFHAGATAKYRSASHQLTIHSGHVTDVLVLFSPAGTHFHVAKDGHGGTAVTLAPAALHAVALQDGSEAGGAHPAADLVATTGGETWHAADLLFAA